MDDQQRKLLMSKLRQPIHVSYISQYILKEDLNKTKEIINSLIEDGILEESKYAKEYYVVKNN
jgi:hypothetical protein